MKTPAWEDTTYFASVACNVSLTLAIGVELADSAPVRLIVATVVVLVLSFPWTAWAQTNALEARRRRDVLAREQRIAYPLRRMNAALNDVGGAAPGATHHHSEHDEPDPDDPWTTP
jgi:hypothetical protein